MLNLIRCPQGHCGVGKTVRIVNLRCPKLKSHLKNASAIGERPLGAADPAQAVLRCCQCENQSNAAHSLAMSKMRVTFRMSMPWTEEVQPHLNPCSVL